MEAAWSLAPDRAASVLAVDPAHGLGEAEVHRRRRRYGRNVLKTTKAVGVWTIVYGQVRTPVVGLLGGAAVLSFAFADWVEGAAILAVLLVNTLLGFVAELRAVRSMEALRRLGTALVRVRRGDEIREIRADALVPGDIVLVEGGDVVTADLRVLDASKLQADESALTGESTPVGKDVREVAADAPIHARSCMLFKGTGVTRGAATAVVTSTGMETELGRIARLVAEAEPETTPLEKRLEALGRRLIWLVLGVAAFTAIAGILSGKQPLVMIEVGIALAVAAIPEGLPIVATLALARGMWRMANRHALINRLSAVEVLGATTVIFTDKTGTLTENKLALVRVVGPAGDGPPADAMARDALDIAVLCNNASLGDHGASGDPLEVALLEAGAAAGISRDALLERHPERREEAFDPATRMMGTVHDGIVAVKGAPEAVLAACAMYDEQRATWLSRADELAVEGLRLLAVARKTEEGAAIYRDLEFVALLGMLDPPREDVRDAIGACRRAGIRVVMVTGDHPATARKIGRAVGLIDDEGARVLEGRDLSGAASVADVSVFARVSPEQKLELIAREQARGEVVAMTGDGVNDAPALKKADIGVAMGQRGTQVARDASDMVLRDDAFSSIVVAVRQGRIIFGNIRQFVVYLLGCNLSEVLIVTGAALVQAPLPLLALQILYLNLVTDVFPALALAFGEGDARVMDRPPRPPEEPILPRRHWRRLAIHSVVIAATVLATLYVAVGPLGHRGDHARTLTFLTLAFAQLWHVFNVRERGSRLLADDVSRNPWVWGAIALCVVLIAGAVYVPGLAAVLDLHPPSGTDWAVILLASLVPLIVGQLAARKRGPPKRTPNTPSVL
jgi:Ca2+-transporting ATPase